MSTPINFDTTTFLILVVALLSLALIKLAVRVGETKVLNAEIHGLRETVDAQFAGIVSKIDSIKDNDLKHINDDIVELRGELDSLRNNLLTHMQDAVNRAMTKFKNGG